MLEVLLLKVDEATGRMTGHYKTYALCGGIRRMVSIHEELVSVTKNNTTQGKRNFVVDCTVVG